MRALRWIVWVGASLAACAALTQGAMAAGAHRIGSAAELRASSALNVRLRLTRVKMEADLTTPNEPGFVLEAPPGEIYVVAKLTVTNRGAAAVPLKKLVLRLTDAAGVTASADDTVGGMLNRGVPASVAKRKSVSESVAFLAKRHDRGLTLTCTLGRATAAYRV